MSIRDNLYYYWYTLSTQLIAKAISKLPQHLRVTVILQTILYESKNEIRHIAAIANSMADLPIDRH
jgi:hypothetical protein